MDCPALLPPAHGYFLRNECKNVFNAACGVRCHSGYQVRKVNILSAHHQVPHLASSLAPALDFVFPPVCGVESHLNARSRLVDRCSRPTMDMFPVLLTIMKSTQLASLGRKGTVFLPQHISRCNFGYRLLGSRKRLCLPISLWGGLPAYCKREIHPSPLISFSSDQVSETKEAKLW